MIWCVHYFQSTNTTACCTPPSFPHTLPSHLTVCFVLPSRHDRARARVHARTHTHTHTHTYTYTHTSHRGEAWCAFRPPHPHPPAPPPPPSPLLRRLPPFNNASPTRFPRGSLGRGVGVGHATREGSRGARASHNNCRIPLSHPSVTCPPQRSGAPRPLIVEGGEWEVRGGQVC